MDSYSKGDKNPTLDIWTKAMLWQVAIIKYNVFHVPLNLWY